jgi:hypothetical protein
MPGKTNTERIGKRRIENDFVSELETILNDVKNLSNEQETLKANLKTRTEKINKKYEAMEVIENERKKAAKLALDKTKGKEFGMDGKR